MMLRESVTGHVVGWQFDNTYSRLPASFFAAALPVRVREPKLAILNTRLANELGLKLDALPADDVAALLAGQVLPQGAEPIAQAYAGHQFGSFTMLGDGRAILLGEHRTPAGGLVDIQFKGAGQTRFSRRGDGRAVLGPMLREYVISEFMAAAGIPTTRSLAVVTTGEEVYRESALPGAVLTRVAASHIRVGTFQFLAARRDEPGLKLLADYAINRHYPELGDVPQKYLAFFRAVAHRQAALIAQWQFVGFIHGVMNTDNMSIAGETIDYGPCAFMNAFGPKTVFSSIDHGGRYSYGNQPAIAQWNLARFAETLVPLFDADEDRAIAIATEVLGEFAASYERYWLEGMRKKIGLQTAEAGDRELIQALLDWMEKSGADFTNTFLDLSSASLAVDRYADEEFQAWHGRWKLRLSREGQQDSAFAVMRAANPAVIPRNHRVEEALSTAQDHNDFSMLHRLLAALSSPYEDRPELAFYREPPPDDRCYRTFCGT
jgi:uncharacterized protein YdiU (UPF0061 family)